MKNCILIIMVVLCLISCQNQKSSDKIKNNTLANSSTKKLLHDLKNTFFEFSQVDADLQNNLLSQKLKQILETLITIKKIDYSQIFKKSFDNHPSIIAYLKAGKQKLFLNPICIIEDGLIYEFFDSYPYYKEYSYEDCSPYINLGIENFLNNNLELSYARKEDDVYQLYAEEVKGFEFSCIDGEYLLEINKSLSNLPQQRNSYLVTNYFEDISFLRIRNQKIRKNLQKGFVRWATDKLNEIPIKEEEKEKFYFTSYFVTKLTKNLKDHFVIGSISRDDKTNIFGILKFDEIGDYEVLYHSLEKEREEIFLGLIDVERDEKKDRKIFEIVTATIEPQSIEFSIYGFNRMTGEIIPVFLSESEGEM